MRWQEGYAFGRMMLAVILIGPGLLFRPLEAEAQQTPEAPIDAAAAAEAPEAVEAAFSPEELQALVAPIALYPDLVLVLALQASLAPLDIVQADRFLARYAEDPRSSPTLTGTRA